MAADLGGKLKQLGYEVAGIISEGEEAIEMADRLQPDLLLLDIQLEGSINGIEAAERIRLKRDVPMIYLTAYADPALQAEDRPDQTFGSIFKPFDERDLATQVEQ